MRLAAKFGSAISAAFGGLNLYLYGASGRWYSLAVGIFALGTGVCCAYLNGRSDEMYRRWQ